MRIRTLKTNFEILQEVRENFKKTRIYENVTQREIARRAGVTIDVVRRFEQQGIITITNLIAIARILDRAEDLLKLFVTDTTIRTLADIDRIEKASRQKQRQRARK